MNTTQTETLLQRITKKLLQDRIIRSFVTRRSHLWFFTLYFANYITHEMAPFQKEIFDITQRKDWKLFLLVAFRGSGKSTIITTSYVLWSILGILKKRYVLILCQTQGQAKQQMMNIRALLEGNSLLRNDLGPFKEESGEWGASTIVFSKYGARIMVASAEQSIRGTRHEEHRPDLVILDDVEDLQSAKTREGRDKTYNWFKGEVVPAGEHGKTTYVVIGNVVHDNCLTMRLRDEIDAKLLNGLSRFYPLVDETGAILWLGKYPDEKVVEEQKRAIGNDAAFDREFLLKAVAAEDQVIDPTWIHYYDSIPKETDENKYRRTYIGVDLAISQKSSADYTAMVVVKVFGYGDNIRLYVLPFPTNDRLTYPEIRKSAQALAERYGRRTQFCIEKVAFQEALAQDLKYVGLKAEGIPVPNDKRERLSLLAHHIQDGRVLFPKKGAEEIINQIIYFPNEKHDDLMDAFTLVAGEVMKNNKRRSPDDSIGPTTPADRRGGIHIEELDILGAYYESPSPIAELY